MKVILLQDVPKVGKKYEIKNVSDGFALNSLIPKKLVKVATAQAVAETETLKAKNQIEIQQQEELQEKDIQMINNTEVSMIVKTDDKGHLFAGIDKEQIATILKDQKAVNLEAKSIVLEKPIKEVGEYEISVKIGKSSGKFKLSVIAEK
jgi:large subunit ribosomal protein L9